MPYAKHIDVSVAGYPDIVLYGCHIGFGKRDHVVVLVSLAQNESAYYPSALVRIIACNGISAPVSFRIGEHIEMLFPKSYAFYVIRSVFTYAKKIADIDI